jgi:hypothetical protein
MFSAGYSDIIPFTCPRDSTVLVIGGHDKRIAEILGRRPNEAWTEEQLRKIEARLIPCSCGARFGRQVLPKCPTCGTELDPPDLGRHWFLVVGDFINGEEQNPWL